MEHPKFKCSERPSEDHNNRTGVEQVDRERRVKMAVRLTDVQPPPSTAQKCVDAVRSAAAATQAGSDEVSVTRASPLMSLSLPSLICTNADEMVPDVGGREDSAPLLANEPDGASTSAESPSARSATGEGRSSSRGGATAGRLPLHATSCTDSRSS